MKRLLVTLATLVVVMLLLPLVSFGLNFSGLGTATTDGIMSPGEWDNAAKLDFQANLPAGEGSSTTPATLYVMNDGRDLYFAVKIARKSFGYETYFSVDFDNNNNGIAEPGDDALAMYVGTTSQFPLTFIDMYRYTKTGETVANGSTYDTDPNGGILPVGKNDGSVGAKNDGTITIIELSHPLCSGDTTHDFCLKPGATVGFKAHLTLKSSTSKGATLVISTAETDIPVSGTTSGLTASGSSYGQITLASPVVVRDIDIKPGSAVNSINMRSEGKIPVAILSTKDWSAPENVDRLSLTFGKTGDENSLAFCSAGSEDVNGDGLPDLVCHFTTQLTGFQTGDTVGILNGKSMDGSLFTGKDSVRIVR